MDSLFILFLQKFKKLFIELPMNIIITSIEPLITDYNNDLMGKELITETISDDTQKLNDIELLYVVSAIMN